MKTLEIKKDGETATALLGKFGCAFRVYWRDNSAMYQASNDGKSWLRIQWDVKPDEVPQMQQFVDSVLEHIK